MKIEKIATGFNLAEGPLYLEDSQTLMWVDIINKNIFSYSENTKEIKSFQFDNFVSAIVPFKENIVICTVTNYIYYFDLINFSILKKVKIFEDNRLRFNDGKCDKYGNLWVGTMAKNQESNNIKNCGSLYCIKKDQVINEFLNFTIPNGLDWKNNYFFHTETADKTIYKYEIKNEKQLLNKEPFLNNFKFYPDGMSLDSNNNLWIALWGGSKIICVNLETKQIIDEIYFEEQNVSCLCFGGKNYKTIYVTTAKDDYHLGSLYKIETSYMGIKPNKYKGVFDG